MALGTCVGQLLVDLDDSGAFATDLGGKWKIEHEWALEGRGRDQEHDAAGTASLVASLDNRDGRFSPKNTGGAYYPNWTAYKQARVKLTFNAVTYDVITGVITDIKVGPEVGDQLCEITIRDYMYVCSRTDIRRPIMRDQYTGVIIHRLLDDVQAAEGRGWVSNPHFEVDDTGYSVIGGATMTRMTDDKILEGPAAERLTTSGASQGLRYTYTGKNGLAGTVYAYVKPERDTDIGTTVRIKMVDTVGTVATGASVALSNRDQWVRLSVSGTYNGGSTSQYIDIEEMTSGFQFRVGAVDAVPSVNAMARAVDDGQSILKQYSYHRGPALSALQEVRENELNAIFYFKGDGTAVLEDRHHRWKDDHLTSQNTFDERGKLDYSESGDDRVKAVVLDYPHYVDGLPGTEFWKLDRITPLPPGQTTTIEADYGGGLLRDTTIPIVNTDYVIRTDGEGAGTDASASVTFTFLDFGGGSSGAFLNNDSVTLYLISYRVRGTPVRLASDTSPIRYTPAGGAALASTLSFDYKLNASEPAISAWAQYLGDRYSVQREKLGARVSAAFPKADITSSDIVPILSRQVSDRVTFTNDNLPFSLKINQDYYIDSIDLRSDGESIEASWRLVPVDLAYYIIGGTLTGSEVLAP
jgi:hypothetical protein